MASPVVEYNFLSRNCGLRVSNICLGTSNFGPKTVWGPFSFPGLLDEEGAHAVLDRYIELGGNFLDTANIYGEGSSEQIIGNWIKKNSRPRGDLVLATKCRLATAFGDQAAHAEGLSRKSIIQAIEMSLERLDTDYVDLYQIHTWDAGVPLNETLRTLNDLVRCGKVWYVGGSNLLGWQVQKIAERTKYMGFDQWVSVQQMYNLCDRKIEYEVTEVCCNEGIGLLPYSPLKGGLLTDKFKQGTGSVPEGTRLAWSNSQSGQFAKMGTIGVDLDRLKDDEKYWKLRSEMASIGEAHDKTIAQVAIRWLLQREPVTSVIIGPKTIKQLEENMAAATGWKLTDQQMESLNLVSGDESVPYPYDLVASFNQHRKRDIVQN